MVTGLEIPDHDRAIIFYVFKEFAHAFVECVYETNELKMTVDNRNLPEGLPFNLTVKDFKYIIENLGEFSDSQEISFTVRLDQDNATANAPDTQVNNGMAYMRFPVVSKMSLGVKHDVAQFYYDVTYEGKVAVHSSTGTEQIHTYVNLDDVALKVSNIRMESLDGKKIHLEYIAQRIEAYLATLGDYYKNYFDEQLPLPNMGNPEVCLLYTSDAADE